MSEKHFRPIIKDGDHLVQSKKNSNRVIGQTRDAENKNPDIIEWEELEDTDYEYELAKMAHEERIAEVRSRQSTVDASTCRKFRQVRKEKNREVSREMPCYNLDMIISKAHEGRWNGVQVFCSGLSVGAGCTEM